MLSHRCKGLIQTWAIAVRAAIAVVSIDAVRFYTEFVKCCDLRSEVLLVSRTASISDKGSCHPHGVSYNAR